VSAGGEWRRLEPIPGPSAWNGADLATPTDRIYALTPAEIADSVMLHTRTAYEDRDAPECTRHLLRLGLAAPDFDDGDEQLRRGIALS
jgi:hypothetical protein